MTNSTDTQTDTLSTVHQEILAHAPALKEISAFMFDNPELFFEEHQAHDQLTDFLDKAGFQVERHYLLPTAWKATFTHGDAPGHTFGLNSEMDALPEIGHACGHPLIAVSGVATLLGMRAAMIKHNIQGTVILLGTPAEERGSGKYELLKRGAYEGMDACVMCHPGQCSNGEGAVLPSLAVQALEIEFFGSTAHAAGAPWDGVNALDAATTAYQTISNMRHQLKPFDRVHGIITNGGQAPNIIPGYTSMRYYVRSITAAEIARVLSKIKPCFEAAAKSTGCTFTVKEGIVLNDLRNCEPLGQAYAQAMSSMFNTKVTQKYHDWSSGGLSTDFGCITYALPSLHPFYGIPCPAGRSNHTPEFEQTARGDVAHEETWKAATGMAAVGLQVLQNGAFLDEARSWWQKDMRDEFLP